MADLSISYLDLPLKNPLVASSSPLAEKIENLQRMEEKGAAAIVLPSLFEEQIELQNLGFPGASSGFLPAELQHIPNMHAYNQGANGYLAYLYKAKKAVKIPIIGSLNGYYSGGWVQYGRLIEAAGADALELNVYYLATKPHIDAHEIENMYLELVSNVKSAVSIPVAVKLSPYFSATANIAQRLAKAGARGLVLFNRFYQPDLDLDTLEVVPNLSLSTSEELRLRLRWAAILHGQIPTDLAITGGVHTAQDVVKCMLAGANVAMMTSALLMRGIGYTSKVYMDLLNWMEEHEYESVHQMRGSMSQKSVTDPTAFERANYMRVLRSYAMKER
ncbi:MAG: dihydroorotate dehydrogenase-like protein [Anaerolineales bacterium]|nr:dihydroorotate dehydrogenase-like protein [Anaerolineales bacterium]